ncbi:nitroreductase family deazaflavin-dependent oxidoreductase [Nocardia sp. NPDC057227]|uniref:nitroreductase family deazaflavin-dependent oxidoreductase n=1 Tax=Nocardia sp. NPDC057227 TaxID=3346056 RepID=UPI00363DB08C
MDKPRLLDSALVGTIMKYGSRANTWIYRRTNGKVGGSWRVGAGFRKPVPTLLLEHTGRRSGKTFTAPLLYITDGADIVVVGSQGGKADHPQWYLNLLAHPQAHVQIGGEHRAVVARAADDAERERLWPRLVEAYADFDTYQSWTQRRIPVMLLSPA